MSMQVPVCRPFSTVRLVPVDPRSQIGNTYHDGSYFRHLVVSTRYLVGLFRVIPWSAPKDLLHHRLDSELHNLQGISKDARTVSGDGRSDTDLLRPVRSVPFPSTCALCVTTRNQLNLFSSSVLFD